MRRMIVGLLGVGFLAVVVAVVIGGSSPQAFHSGGVAECAGCHSMHEAPASGSFLLVGSTPTSTCLTCHEYADTTPSSYHVATKGTSFGPGVIPVERTPGGDFAWLKKTYNWVYNGVPASEDGSTHGHNVVAPELGYNVDPTNVQAPGGTFSSAQLGCESCHDPHSPARRLSDGSYVTGLTMGQATAPIIGSGSYNNSAIPKAGEAVGVYRLLRGLGASIGGVTYPNSVAIAVAPSTYNQSEATNMVRVAYGHSGSNTWGNWCGTCHPHMHEGENKHPVDDTLGSEVATNYNAYIASGDLSGGGQTFTSLVPFIENTGDIATLQSHSKNNNTYMNGPSASDRVSCLSCHRAHASGMIAGLRFDVEYEFMVKNGDYIGYDNPAVGTTGRGPVQARGRNIAEWKASYYDRPATHFAKYQRVLCNKCHAKD